MTMSPFDQRPRRGFHRFKLFPLVIGSLIVYIVEFSDSTITLFYQGKHPLFVDFIAGNGMPRSSLLLEFREDARFVSGKPL